MPTKVVLTQLLLVGLSVSLVSTTRHTQRGTLPAREAGPIKLVNTYPELQVNGQPFFVHSAAFFYPRLPRDEWGPALVKLKEMGVNTVDLYLPWNWHEPEEGRLDFDGHTNPRRDVKGLLEMIEAMGLMVIARPGPVILNEWRNGGYPEWLLERPEYRMAEGARLDGHYPPLSGLSPSNSEAASREWLANETHLRYTRRWFGQVMRELLGDRQVTRGGPVLAIQLDDDQAINRTNYNGPSFWQYMTTLAGYLREGGATVPVYINPTDMRVSAAGAPHGIGAMGQWYFNFGSDPALRWEDTATLQFYTETLKTQPHFPPMIIEYQAGWYGTGDDTYAKTADPTNTLLSSRVLLAHGLRGLNYFPAQDTLNPAGYEVPWANHYYTWESALNLSREERPRAEAVYRNGRLIAGLGRELAAAHKAADVGLVYPISSFDQASLTREDILRISRVQMQVQQYCQLNQVAVEYVDLEFQPLEQLQRHQALLLPVFDRDTLAKTGAEGREEITAAHEPATGQLKTGAARQTRLGLSALAQRKLVDYVRAGGRLICTPVAPEGEIIKELFAQPESRVSILPDLWRQVPLEPGKAGRAEVIADLRDSSAAFVDLLRRARVRRKVSARIKLEGDASAWSDEASIEPNFIATLLIEDGGGRPRIGGRSQSGFISVINFDDRWSMRVRLSVIDPSEVRSAAWHRPIELPEFTLRPRDAMLLPVGVQSISYATAELVRRDVGNGRIRMRFYAPDPAEVVLNLPQAPQGVVSIDGVPADASYDPRRKLLTIKLIPPKTRQGEKPSDRREHEHDIEIVDKTGVPELNVMTTRLISGEVNQVAVEVTNPAAETLRGRLYLTAPRRATGEEFKLAVDLAPREMRRFNFTVPLDAKAVAGDRVSLRAELWTEVSGKGRAYFSPSVAAEVRSRFEWQVRPGSQWPIRSDTAQESRPPLILPTGPVAGRAEFSLWVKNNSTQELNLSPPSDSGPSPTKLDPGEELSARYTYNFAPGTKSVLNPFEVTLSDGRTTEVARANFLALRQGEAVAYAYDLDRDGFDDYVLENEHLRLIISPRAGARSFALINKHTGANAFTSVGGLRDQFVELDPADPTRNPRRKRGMYGTFNRSYQTQIIAATGKRAVLRLSYQAPDAYPAGARIERVITLGGEDEFFTVDYQVTPGAADGKQAFWSANSTVVGDPTSQAWRWVAEGGEANFAAGRRWALDAATGWLAARGTGPLTLAFLWRGEEVNSAEVEMKDFSSLVNLRFRPFASRSPHPYRLVCYFGSWSPGRVKEERTRLLNRE